MDFIKQFLSNIFGHLFKSEDLGGRETPIPDSLKTATIGLIVGHTNKRGGAALATGGNEYSYNTRVARIAKAYALKDFPYVDCHIIFRDNIGISGAYNKARELGCDVIIELHFNAFNNIVIGTETLCSNEKMDQDFAAILQREMCLIFNRVGKSRGVKTIARGANGGINVYSAPGTPNCLVEPFFGDVISEAKMAVEKQEIYARSLVRCCVEYLQGTGVL